MHARNVININSDVFLIQFRNLVKQSTYWSFMRDETLDVAEPILQEILTARDWSSVKSCDIIDGVLKIALYDAEYDKVALKLYNKD